MPKERTTAAAGRPKAKAASPRGGSAAQKRSTRRARPGAAGSGKPLIIVESPTKARTIERAFGRSYRVAASLGHLRDLPRSQLGVDVEQDFEPRYITVRGRGEVVKNLRAAGERAKRTFFAADPDREGEAIAWHLAQLLGVDPTSPCRIEFHEITKEAIAEAIKRPRPIDMDLVDAQQARRVLDRLVGYELSPLLWRKVRRGLSAGRVQSVAVRLISDREAEIASFVPEEYWTLTAYLTPASGGGEGAAPTFPARFAGVLSNDGKIEKLDPVGPDRAREIEEGSRRAAWRVIDVRRGTRRRNPQAPFTTSTLQQEAAHQLGCTVRRTMAVAQQLYEGVDLGEAGPVGLITYMRTDATRVADSARAETRAYVARVLGGDYLPAEPPKYRAGRRAQEAHEAIRPTDPTRTPDTVRPFLSEEQYRLYRLIWARFIASEMTQAVYSTVAADFAAGPWVYRASGSELRFPGFLAAATLAGVPPATAADGGDGQPDQAGASSEAGGGTSAEELALIPDLEPGQAVVLRDLVAERHFTTPPPRYSEASLVKTMEELGIGRPSTYAPTVETILSRGYVAKEQGRLVPTRLGQVVNDLLVEHFPDIVDVAFTAGMEDKLDKVEEGEMPWRKVVRAFYEPFARSLREAEARLGRVEIPEEETGITCTACGRPMVVKYGRFGRFLACSGYPECRQTKPYSIPAGVTCPKCGALVVEKRTKRGRRFYGCIRYPECDFSVWSKPSGEKCPVCGSFLVASGRGGRDEAPGGRLLKCSNETCGYESVGGQVEPGNQPGPESRPPLPG